MAVSPAAFSSLLASAQQFREHTQAEAHSEDTALSPGLVRPRARCQGCFHPTGQGGEAWARTTPQALLDAGSGSPTRHGTNP